MTKTLVYDGGCPFCKAFALRSELKGGIPDLIIRDGDEEGHVGAAEIFKDWLVRGEYGQFTTQLFWGNLGEYPPLFAGYIGFWWWLFDVQPEDQPHFQFLSFE